MAESGRLQQTMSIEDIARQASRMTRDIDRRLERQSRLQGHAARRAPPPTLTRDPSDELRPRRIQLDVPPRGRECILCNYNKDGTRLGEIDREALAKRLGGLEEVAFAKTGKLTPETEKLIDRHGGPGQRDYHMCQLCVEINSTKPLHSRAYRIAARSIAMENSGSRIARPEDFGKLARSLHDDLHKSSMDGTPHPDAVNAAKRLAGGKTELGRNADRILASRFNTSGSFEEPVLRITIDHARKTIATEVGSEDWPSLMETTKRDFEAFAQQYAHSKAGREALKAIEEFAESIPSYELSETQVRRMAGETLALDDFFQGGRTSADYGLQEDRVLDTSDLVLMSSADVERSQARLSDLQDVERLGLTEGTVKWFDVEKGVGMITAQAGEHAGKDFFVHETGIHGYGIKDISPRDPEDRVEVLFEAVRTNDGLLGAESLAKKAREPISAELGSSWITKPNEAIGSDLHRSTIQRTHQMDLDSQQGHRYAYEQTRGIKNTDTRKSAQDRILASWNRSPGIGENLRSPENPLTGFQVRPKRPSVRINGVQLGEQRYGYSSIDETRDPGDMGGMRYHFKDTDKFIREWAADTAVAIRSDEHLSPTERAVKLAEVEDYAKLPEANPRRTIIELAKQTSVHDEPKNPLAEYRSAPEVSLVKDYGSTEYMIRPMAEEPGTYEVTDRESGRKVGEFHYDDRGEAHTKVDPGIGSPDRAAEVLKQMPGKFDPNIPYVEGPALPPIDRFGISEGVQQMLTTAERYRQYLDLDLSHRNITTQLRSAQGIVARIEHASKITQEDGRSFNDSVKKAFKNPDQVRADLAGMTYAERRNAFQTMRADAKGYAQAQGWEVKDPSWLHAAAAHGINYNDSKERLDSFSKDARDQFDLPANASLKQVHTEAKARVEDLGRQQLSVSKEVRDIRVSSEKVARLWSGLTPAQQNLVAESNPRLAEVAEDAAQKLAPKALGGHAR